MLGLPRPLSWREFGENHFIGSERFRIPEHEAQQIEFALGNYYYWCRKDYDRALEAFAFVQERVPSNLDVLEFVDFIWRRQGRWEEAAANLEQAIALLPHQTSAYYEKTYSHWLRGAFDEARATQRSVGTGSARESMNNNLRKRSNDSRPVRLS